MTTTPAPGQSSSRRVRAAHGRELRLVISGTEKSMMGGASSMELALPAALATDLDGSFEALVTHFQDRLFTFALRLTGRREDAEEVAQDAFVRAYRALKTYPPERVRAMALKAWLYQVTLNVARNRLRRKRHPTVSLDEGHETGRRPRVSPRQHVHHVVAPLEQPPGQGHGLSGWFARDVPPARGRSRAQRT